MDMQIKSVCQSSFLHLRAIRRVRNAMDKGSLKLLIHALIFSRLDYCNSLLVSLPQKSILKLQAIQNAAARLLCNKRKFDHVTPLLKELCWEPVTERIRKKIAAIMHKALWEKQPEYLANRVKWHKPARPLRSSDTNRAENPTMKTCIGERALSKAGPSIWNNLPQKYRSENNFKRFCGMLKSNSL
jgi:hypothetical protein